MGKIIQNVKLVLPENRVKAGCIKIENGLICKLSDEVIVPEKDDIVIDGKGLYASPGFIDLHTHGAGGYDFMDGTVDAFLRAAEMHASHGTTSLCPTTLTSTNDVLFDTLKVYKEAKSLNKQGASFLGIHLEGPYFSYNQRGAQDPKYLRNPCPEEYLSILESTSDIVRWSLAPELDGALEMGKELCSRGILPSIAHTDATYEEVLSAFQVGFTHITHLYSCMSTVSRRQAYRYAGVVEAAYLIDDMTVEIIADGVHLPSSLLQFVYKFKGADRIALVTDSMRGAGMPDGLSVLGSLSEGQEVLIEEGVAKLLDRSAFAGSVATTDRLVRNMMRFANVPLCDAVKMATQTPARILGVDMNKGKLALGMDADIILFDSDIHVFFTMVGGEIVYNEVDKVIK